MMTEAMENISWMKDKVEHILKIWDRKRESTAKQRLAPGLAEALILTSSSSCFYKCKAAA